MKLNLDVDIHHLARVEGHGNIAIEIKDGRLVAARWEVVETPRYFEIMLKGKHYTTAPMLTSRICGICSIGHTLASLRATERAFDVTIPPAATKLRLLAKHGETLQSHYLHLFFLAAPDFLGVPSVLPLIESHPELVDLARRLKGQANRLCDLVAGRTTHPVSLQVGGVTQFPPRDRLLELRDQLMVSLAEVETTAVDLFASFDIPDFARETEFVALKGESGYPFIGGRLISTDGVDREESDYLAMTNEYAVAEGTSKLCRLSRDTFAVGALARYNNNHRWLDRRAQKVADRLGLAPVCHNPFMNNVAQLVECVHVTAESIALIEELADSSNSDRETMATVTPRAGEGVGAVEVPRGILYHHYEYDDGGRIVRANCVIPTTQNNGNIQADLVAFAEANASAPMASGPAMTDERLALLCAMLVRAYDPCISCSVH